MLLLVMQLLYCKGCNIAGLAIVGAVYENPSGNWLQRLAAGETALAVFTNISISNIKQRSQVIHINKTQIVQTTSIQIVQNRIKNQVIIILPKCTLFPNNSYEFFLVITMKVYLHLPTLCTEVGLIVDIKCLFEVSCLHLSAQTFIQINCILLCVWIL